MRLTPRHIAAATVLIALGFSTVIAAPRVQRWLAVREAERLLMHPLPPSTDPKRFEMGKRLPVLPPPEGGMSSETLEEMRTALLPQEINLPVPFTVQAPHGNWELPYQEACEEASALMAIRYAFGNPILSPEDADAGLQDLLQANEAILGYPIDQTAAQVRDLILEIDSRLSVMLLQDPSIADLKRELSSGKVVIVPASGAALRNPFFRTPPPRYHMLVLRGYTADGYFITNDPGTRRGEGYLYPTERIMEAMGDWDPEKREADMGQRVVVVVGRLNIEN